MALGAEGEDGEPLVPSNSHVRLGAEGGESILRRSYSYTDGMDRERGQLDALNEYISHTGSAVFACPPGVREGGYVGEGLFDGT